MTKNKRFVYYEHKGADYILDSPDKSLDFLEMLGDCLEAEEIVDLLNQLYDENEQLKQENKKLQGKYDHILWLYNGLGCEYDWLKDENQQLKQYKQSVNNVLRSWSQKNLTAKQLQAILAIMEELNVIGNVE